MKWPAIIGNLLSTRRCVGASVGMSVMCKSGDGLSKGSKCFLGVGVGFSSFGIGFLASDGQKRSWNWRAISEVGQSWCGTGTCGCAGGCADYGELGG
jgi:hypothetical protein